MTGCRARSKFALVPSVDSPDAKMMAAISSAHRQPFAPPAAMTTNIVIADDHAVVRSGLRMLLEAEEGLEVVAEAADAATALRRVRGHRPTFLILDLNM